MMPYLNQALKWNTITNLKQSHTCKAHDFTRALSCSNARRNNILLYTKAENSIAPPLQLHWTARFVQAKVNCSYTYKDQTYKQKKSSSSVQCHCVCLLLPCHAAESARCALYRKHCTTCKCTIYGVTHTPFKDWKLQDKCEKSDISQ